MEGRQCKFQFSVEIDGNWVKKDGQGIVHSKPFMKKTEKGDFMVLLVENSADGRLHEVFANSVSLVK